MGFQVAKRPGTHLGNPAGKLIPESDMTYEADTFYRERRGAGWAYWTYTDGLRHSISAPWAEAQVARGTAKLVTVES